MALAAGFKPDGVKVGADGLSVVVFLSVVFSPGVVDSGVVAGLVVDKVTVFDAAPCVPFVASEVVAAVVVCAGVGFAPPKVIVRLGVVVVVGLGVGVELGKVIVLVVGVAVVAVVVVAAAAVFGSDLAPAPFPAGVFSASTFFTSGLAGVLLVVIVVGAGVLVAVGCLSANGPGLVIFSFAGVIAGVVVGCVDLGLGCGGLGPPVAGAVADGGGSSTAGGGSSFFCAMVDTCGVGAILGTITAGVASAAGGGC